MFSLFSYIRRKPSRTITAIVEVTVERERPDVIDSFKKAMLETIEWPANDRALPLEVKAGSLIAFNGVLPHFSDANRSHKSRHAFTLHITSSQAQYSKHNWLRAAPMRILS